MKRPVGVTVVSSLSIAGGALLLLEAIGYLGLPALRTTLLLGTLTGITSFMILFAGVLTGALGAAAILAGVGALSLRRRAWLAGLVTWGIAIIFAGVQLVSSGVALLPVLTGIIAIVTLIYMSSEAVFGAFGIETPEHYTTHHPSAA